MKIYFTHLTEPTAEIAAAFTRWENDPVLAPLSRPNKNQADLDRQRIVTHNDVTARLSHAQIFGIYLDGQLIGDMDYQVDPGYVFKREAGTAWISITIGEEIGRGKGIGYQAIQYLEGQIRSQA